MIANEPESQPTTLPSDVATVAVIGAGISGLAVAQNLSASGIDVVVFERRDRVGGRLLSRPLAPPSSLRLDLGASWFWPGERRVAELVSDLGIATHPQHIAGDAMYHDTPTSQRIAGNPIDVPAIRFTDGAQGLADAVAATLPPETVRLSTTVDAVTGTGPFSVETSAGSLRADHVVVALPPALAIDALRFKPALPSRLAGLARSTPVWMGAMTKIVASYETAFWRAAGLAGSAISHIGPMRELHDMSGPDGEPAALFGFAPATGTGPPPSESAVVDQLEQIFGPEAAAPREVVIVDWRAEAATSPPGVERLTAYQTFAHPLYQGPTEDRPLHWVSTETGPTSPGHIEGALAAAERTAATITQDRTTVTPT